MSSESKNNTENYPMKGWLFVLLGALFYAYQFALRVSPNVMNEEIMHVFLVDAGVVGILISIYYWSYTIMQVPLGLMIDKMGPKIFLCGAAFLCAFACYLFGNTQDLLVANFARFLMGMGGSCGLIGTIKLGTIWVAPQHIAKVTGFTIGIGTVGSSILGGPPLRYLVRTYGLEHSMEIEAIIGVIIGILIFLVIPKTGKDKIKHSKQASREFSNFYEVDPPFANFVKMIKQPQAWLLSIFSTLMYSPLTLIGAGWGVQFLEKANDISEIVASMVVATMTVGAAIGGIVVSIVSDAMKSRKGIMIFGAITTTILWSVILLLPNIPLYVMFVLFFIAGFIYTTKCLTFATICESNIKISGTAIAFMNMLVMSAGIIFHPTVGWLLDFHWDGTMLGNIRSYSAEDFRFALGLTVPTGLAISFFLMLFVKESHPEANTTKKYGAIVETGVL